ncbi:MAG: phytanoyl-CoA dioxygenase family protein, partial [Alkalinema sp. CAN_BIN05]|nr:phytanoyl-CoA dioxygenase family protein [Alkalinema sp. CAN_BIN05]
MFSSLSKLFTLKELQDFDRDGFIIVRQLAQPELIDRINQLTDNLLQNPIQPIEYEAELGYPGAPELIDEIGSKIPRRFLNAFCRGQSLYDWATHPDVLSRLHQLIGKSIALSLAHHNSIMTKHPDFSSDTGWHRDLRYWSFNSTDLITVFLALTPSNAENGGLRFLPRSHKDTIEDHQLDNKSFLKTDLPENQALLDREVTIDLDPGDAIFFHSLTFHGAPRNRTKQERRSLLFTYHDTQNHPMPGTRSASMPELHFTELTVQSSNTIVKTQSTIGQDLSTLH